MRTSYLCSCACNHSHASSQEKELAAAAATAKKELTAQERLNEAKKVLAAQQAVRFISDVFVSLMQGIDTTILTHYCYFTLVLINHFFFCILICETLLLISLFFFFVQSAG